MLLDNRWHSSSPLAGWKRGDVLRVKNRETGELVDWEVIGEPVELTSEEAKAEWEKYPFGSSTFAQRYGYFPYLAELRRLREVPPPQHSPRYIPSDVRVQVWQRDGGRCKSCASIGELEFDHIIPVSRGGSNTANNIELLCAKCNRSKGSKII